MSKFFTLFAVALFTAGFCFSLTGCNTVDGAGDDLKEASDDTRDAMDLD